MTKDEVGEAINGIIKDAIKQGKGAWLGRNYYKHVEQIFTVMGKLSPEPKAKPQVPEYNPKKVKRVGTLVERSNFTQEQRDAAVAALRAVGLL